MDAGCSTDAPAKRARRVGPVPGTPEQLSLGPASRPTEAERAAAVAVIKAMRETIIPILSGDGGREDPKVVACALALYFEEKFASDRAAKIAFGIGPSTDVRKKWVEDKLWRLHMYDPGSHMVLHRAP